MGKTLQDLATHIDIIIMQIGTSVCHSYSGDSDHLFWFCSTARSSQRDGSDSITVSDRIQSVRS